MKSSVLVAACLLAAVPAPGAGRKPTRFVRVEAIAIGWMGLTDSPAIWGRLLGGTCIIDRYRFGLTYNEDFGMYDIWDGGMTLPIQIGYTLWSHPVRTWFLYNFVPDLYAQASVGLLDNSFRYGPGARLSLCCDADFCGLGARIEAGWFTVHCGEGQQVRESDFYVGAQVRLLTLGIGF